MNAERTRKHQISLLLKKDTKCYMVPASRDPTAHHHLFHSHHRVLTCPKQEVLPPSPRFQKDLTDMHTNSEPQGW
jgi:hypothetical protein